MQLDVSPSKPRESGSNKDCGLCYIIMSSTSDNNANSTREKKPLKFVSEGVGNVEAQRIREQVEQKKYEAEYKRKTRKSLRDQLRSNAISKQKQYNGLVRDRESFTRLSKEDLNFTRRARMSC